MPFKDFTQLQSLQKRIDYGNGSDFQGFQAGLVQIEHGQSPRIGMMATVLFVAAAWQGVDGKDLPSMSYVNLQSITVRILANRRNFFWKNQSLTGRVDKDKSDDRITAQREEDGHRVY